MVACDHCILYAKFHMILDLFILFIIALEKFQAETHQQWAESLKGMFIAMVHNNDICAPFKLIHFLVLLT